jgi:hypothetical protein
MTAIRHIAVAEGADLFATAEFEHTVSVWSFRHRKRVAMFETVLDFGGKRLMLTAQPRPMVVAGAYENGVCGYDAHAGACMWTKQDLRKTQIVSRLKHENERSVCGIGDDHKYRILDIASGDIVRELKGVKEVYSNRFNNSTVLVVSGKLGFSANASFDMMWSQATEKPILAVASSPTAISVSQSGGSVISFDLQGRVLWKWQPQRDHHALSLCWQERLKVWLGVLWCFEHGGPRLLISLSEQGELVSTKAIDTGECPATEIAFLEDGEHLITSQGQVLSVPDLHSEWNFVAE